MINEQEKLLAQFRLTQIKYCSRIPDKISHIESHWMALQKNPDDLTSRKELVGLVHNLSGSAATFGFSQLGNLARNIELLLESQPCDVQTIDKNITKMKSALDSPDPESETIKKILGFKP